ncbi:major facilitator superfamily domain-containing protein 1-like [Cimex lectularius]|uniref:Lysosomal dipeptide transporter MFSD1 n=1 Tax=Cimex lectularius TaxID=79782 RepID=A0A8I6RKL3_CIMLE|nr:major facilitator superfamily domain-containing protein 1-like [Cimex lectularius]
MNSEIEDVSDKTELLREEEGSEEEIEEKKPACSPDGACFRYLGLAWMCLLGFGSYFCYDNPGAMQDIITKDMKLTTTQFTYLYTFYSWPNIVLCYIGGFLIDRIFGIRFGTCLYALIVFLGQLLVAFGSFIDSFNTMLLGRLIFGIGGESLAVAQNYYAVQWFKGKELNMIFGLQLSFARVGSMVNFLSMSKIYEHVHEYFKGREALGVTLLLASATCLMSFVSSVFLALMDSRRKKPPPVVSATNDEDEEDKVEIAKLSDAKDFSAAFWLITVICVAYYLAIFPFIALGKVFFMKKFGFSSAKANFVNSFVYGMSGVASPILGFLVDRTGWNVFWVFISIISTMVAHGLLAFTFFSPFYAMILLGLSYSMCASALWPMISLVIPEYQLGSAYGIAQALQNLGLAVSTMLAGMVVDAGGYMMLEIFFIMWLIVSLIACLLMWLYDLKTTGILNMTVKQRDLYEQMKPSSSLNKLVRKHSYAGVSPYLVTQQSDDQVRNRLLSKAGETSEEPNMSGGSSEMPIA